MKRTEIFKGHVIKDKETGMLYVIASDYYPHMTVIPAMNDEDESEYILTPDELVRGFELQAERKMVIHKQFIDKRVQFQIDLMISDIYSDHYFYDEDFDAVYQSDGGFIYADEESVDEWLQSSLVKFTDEEWFRIIEDLSLEEEEDENA